MAWILNQPFEASDFSDYGESARHYSDMQKAVYTFFPDWTVANDYTFPASTGGDENVLNYDWINRARAYTENWKNEQSASLVDNYNNTSNLSKEIVNYDGSQWIKIGPFNWSYTGTYEKCDVFDQNDNLISARYAKYNGNNLEVYTNVNDASKSGQDFYILIPANQGISKISRINAGVVLQKELLTAEMWTLRLNYDGFEESEMQTLISTVPEKKTTEDRMELLLPTQ